jgi:hypothetical protein
MATLPSPATPARRARAFWVVLGGLWAFLAAVAWFAPVQGDDWLPMYWIGQHGGGPLSVLGYLARHRSIGDLAAIVLVTAPIVHVLLSPTIALTLLIGIIALARGRIPRPRDPDSALLLFAASTMIWIGAPRAGLDFFYRPYLAHFVYGLTAVIWLLYLIVHRAHVARGRGATIAIGALALIAGTSNHYIAPVLLYALWQRLRAARAAGRAPTWQWVALILAAIGALLMFTNRPFLPLHAIGRGGFEHNVFRLYLFMGQCGELVALLMIVFFALALRLQGPRAAIPTAGGDAIALAGRAYVASLIMAVLAVFSPRWGEPAMLAPVVALTIAGLALLEPSWGYRPLRRAVVIAGVLVHGLVIAMSLPRYVRARAEFDERMAAIAAAPAGGVARIAPYRKTEQDAWFFGDDLMYTRIRGRVAVDYGLRAIDYTGPFSRLEPSAGFRFVERWSPTETTPLLTDDLDVARSLFNDHTRDHDAPEQGPATLELVGGLDWPGRAGRPLIAARYVDGELMIPDFDFTPMDKKQRFSIAVDPDSMDGAYPEAVMVSAGATIPFTRDDDDHWVFPPRTDRYTLVRCNPRACWVVQSIFNPL